MVDAVVVGAGPTGLTMAAELRRHGLDVRLVEQLEAPSRLSRALAVQSRTLEIFDALGLAERALARGRRAEAFNVMGPGGVRARVPLLDNFSWLETRFPSLLMLPQDATEALLTRHLESLGGRVERGVALDIYQQDATGVTVSLRYVGGQLEKVNARWLLGCDGARSRVRKVAGIPFEGETYDDACVLADVKVEWSLGQGELCLLPSSRGVLAAFPMPGEKRYRLFAILPRDALPETHDDLAPFSLEEMQALVDQMAPVPARLSEPRWLSRYRLHRRGVPRYRQGRVFLAGDAAHIHSPAGGQGMNTGIQDAWNLAWKLALVTRGRAPESLLDTYEQERHPVGRKLLRGTDRLFGAMARGGPAARFLRAHLVPRLARRVLGARCVQRRLFRFVSQLTVRYRHSSLSTEHLGDERGQPRRERGPVPGARLPDLPVRGEGVEHLHQVARGPQHTLLLFTGLESERRERGALEALGRQLEATHGPEFLRVWVVAAGEWRPGSRVLADDTGALHRRFGAESSCFYLVRPDGYVGHREWPLSLERLEVELTRRLGP